jgi:hypothetical protein
MHQDLGKKTPLSSSCCSRNIEEKKSTIRCRSLAGEVRRLMQPVDSIVDWSRWVPIAEAAKNAPTVPGVYMARQGIDGPVVYVGMAGERRGQGLRGRLAAYVRGKGLVSGLGEAIFDRALADPAWVRERLSEAERGQALRAKQWGAAAVERAGFFVRWTTARNKDEAREIERRITETLRGEGLWNRIPPIR